MANPLLPLWNYVRYLQLRSLRAHIYKGNTWVNLQIFWWSLLKIFDPELIELSPSHGNLGGRTDASGSLGQRFKSCSGSYEKVTQKLLRLVIDGHAT